MNIEKKIAIIGLGYVGLPLAVEFGKHRETLGFDINELRIDELKNNTDSTLEVCSDELIKSTNLKFTSNENNLDDVQIFIITVPTPVDASNRPNLEPLIAASKTVGRHLKKKDIVIYESTVFPGCTEDVCVPVLEEISELKYNKDFFCGYSPERINPGDKINTLTKIKKITSGSTPEIGKEVDNLYNSIITAGTFLASSIEVAEAAKVIENTQRDLNIALINELSVIFDKLNIDTLDVLEAAESKWNFLPFRPGLVGGHCIGVDPYYLTYRAEQAGYNPQVILAGRRINDNMARYAAKRVIQKMIVNRINIHECTIGVMGITFKENCPDIRNSKIFDILSELESWGVNVIVTDPWVDENELLNNYGVKLGVIDEFNKVDSLIVAVGHNEYRNLSVKVLKSYCKSENPVLGDIKSLYNKDDLAKEGFSIFRL